MAALSQEQIEQKKQLLAEKMKEANAIAKELQEAGALPLDEDDLDEAAGGLSQGPVKLKLKRGPQGIQY